MPIYAYRCEECGFAKDVLQKVSDAPLTDCPSCSKSTFKKQLTAAGFQLKGTGWYVTDFRNNGTGKANATATAPKGASTSDAPASTTSTTSTTSTGSSASPGTTASGTSAPAAAS